MIRLLEVFQNCYGNKHITQNFFFCNDINAKKQNVSDHPPLWGCVGDFASLGQLWFKLLVGLTLIHMSKKSG